MSNWDFEQDGDHDRLTHLQDRARFSIKQKMATLGDMQHVLAREFLEWVKSHATNFREAQYMIKCAEQMAGMHGNHAIGIVHRADEMLEKEIDAAVEKVFLAEQPGWGGKMDTASLIDQLKKSQAREIAKMEGDAQDEE